MDLGVQKIDPKDVQVLNFTKVELPFLLGYFYDSPASFLESIGLKTPTPEDRSKAEQNWNARFEAAGRENKKLKVMSVFYKQELAGFHTASHCIEGESLIMHAHFLAGFRGLGIGTVSYVKAMEKFFSDFNLKTIIFKTPELNAAALHIKVKLGMVSTVEEVIDWPALIRPLKTKVFKVFPEDLPNLMARVGITPVQTKQEGQNEFRED